MGWVCPRAILNDCEKRKPSSIAGTQTLDITARSPVSIPNTLYPVHCWIVANRPKNRSLHLVSGLAYKYAANGQKDYRGGRDCWHISCLCYRIVNNICSMSTTALAQGWTICPSSLDTRNCKGVTLLILTLNVVFALVSLYYNSQYLDYSILETYSQYYFKPLPFIFYYFVHRPTNAQLSHKLWHSYISGHYCVILREFVLSTFPVYTNALVGNII